MKAFYQNFNFTDARLELIDKCNVILDEYAAAGYDMTLRQLYYQLVGAGEIPNNQLQYKRLGVLVNDARLAGLIDWDYVVDRTRSLKGNSHWESPSAIMATVADAYRLDLWSTQTYRPEVWVEKDALVGVFERVCNRLDVPFFSCRGYTSQSEMYVAAERMHGYIAEDKQPFIFHFGDHDPSGIDMSRDIQDRLKVFGAKVTFERLALNRDQVRRHRLPPNPAKLTDTRCKGYIELHGESSWELDALRPDVLAGLVEDSIFGIIDREPWEEITKQQTEEREALSKIRDRFDAVQKYVKKLK